MITVGLKFNKLNQVCLYIRYEGIKRIVQYELTNLKLRLVCCKCYSIKDVKITYVAGMSNKHRRKVVQYNIAGWSSW